MSSDSSGTPRHTPTRRARAALVAVLLGSTALGGFAAHQAIAQNSPATTQASSTPAAPIQPAAPAQALPDFADLVTRVRPAVVQVTTELGLQPAADTQEGPGFGPGQGEGGGHGRMMPMPGPFGGMPFGQMPFGTPGNPHQGHPHAMEARGSGFIIDADGTIVTNNHVVHGAKSVSVTLDDGTVVPAKVVGRDARTDLAVLRISTDHKLPFIELGDSARVRPGQWVVAMGNPFGLGGSVTAGIVSASGRDIGEGPYDNFIQVDAPINQGNSGGPLFTQDGHVVGVNTAILSPTGGSVGIGFAIPSDMVRTVVAQLEKDGHVTRGYLGVETQPISPAMAAALKLDHSGGEHAGALVASVEPGSPAAKAGVQPGDVITGVNGQHVTNPRELAVDVAGLAPGSDAKVDVLRDGATQTLSAALATMPGAKVADAGHAGGPAAGKPTIGLALVPVSPEMRGQLDLPADASGAVVAQVRPGSAADEAGLRQGDVVVGVGTRAVNSPEAAVKAIHEAVGAGDQVALRVLRNGHSTFVAVASPKPGQGTPGQGQPGQGDQTPGATPDEQDGGEG